MPSRKSALPGQGSGGRAATTETTVSQSSELPWSASPPEPTEARLTVVQVTDVYTLSNFASLKTMLEETRAKSGNSGCKVISMLTGDFLAPYLLSSVDRGAGMMNALAKTPIDYLTWGNHEADIDHRTSCTHVKNFPGTFINTNMQSHSAMKYQKPFEIIEVSSPDGSQTRRIGLIAVLSADSDLYSHHPSPGAFGGAKIDDPWETLAKYKAMLEGPEYGCDVVIPLQHLYVPDDHKTCRKFDFPVVLSGHDHHRVDEVVEGSRLLKPGLDAVYATVLDISWSDDKQKEPTISARFVKVDQWEPDPELQEQCERAYDALAPLRDTELAQIPEAFNPLSSVNSRGSVTTMGRMICSVIRSSINSRHKSVSDGVDGVIIMGGNIRGGTLYPSNCFFSLEALEAEIKGDEVIAVISMPGWLLSDGICATHAGDPIPGWFQYDCGIEQDGPGGPVTTVGGEPIDRDRIYKIATKISDLTNGQSPPFTEYYTAHPEMLPPKGAYVNIHAEIMTYLARSIWRKLFNSMTNKYEDVEDRFKKLDLNSDGVVSVEEIQAALRDIVGLSVHTDEMSLAKFVHTLADITGDGQLTMEDMIMFDEEIERSIKSERKSRFSFGKDVADWTMKLGGGESRRSVDGSKKH